MWVQRPNVVYHDCRRYLRASQILTRPTDAAKASLNIVLSILLVLSDRWSCKEGGGAPRT